MPTVEGGIRLPPDGTGQIQRTFQVNPSGSQVEQQEAVSLAASDGTILDAYLLGVAQDGSDGSSPPAHSGSGIRGWLRSIYDKLSASIAVTQSGSWGVSASQSGTWTEANSAAIKADLDSLLAATPALTLTARMLAKQPQTGYSLYMDTSQALGAYDYIAEAPVGTATTAASWAAIRIPFNAGGDVAGVVMVATNFKPSDASGTWS